ncbi:MAG: hypothetical protein AAFR58_18485 [Cyanobacteria bacterium J06627_28]
MPHQKSERSPLGVTRDLLGGGAAGGAIQLGVPWWPRECSTGVAVKRFRGIDSLTVFSPLFHDT